jgi:hypothetical protein
MRRELRLVPGERVNGYENRIAFPTASFNLPYMSSVNNTS